MTAPGFASDFDEDPLGALFDSSPAQDVHTSAAAEVAFLLGLLALACSPFSLLIALVLGMAAAAVVSGVVGLAQASRPGVAGGVLAAVGLVLGLVSLGLVGLRYAGVDTAFGDELLPTLHDWLESLNGLVPTP